MIIIIIVYSYVYQLFFIYLSLESAFKDSITLTKIRELSQNMKDNDKQRLKGIFDINYHPFTVLYLFVIACIKLSLIRDGCYWRKFNRRKKENELRLSRSTEGPAHHVVGDS